MLAGANYNLKVSMSPFAIMKPLFYFRIVVADKIAQATAFQYKALDYLVRIIVDNKIALD